MLRLPFAFAAFVLLAASATAQTYTGALAVGDDTLNSGEFVDEYSVAVESGETVRATVTSSAFDTYVIIKSAADEQTDNDDCTEGETTRSCASRVADEDGRMRVLVTSYAVGETGDYAVTIAVGGEVAPLPTAGELTLAEGDPTMESGEFYDVTTVRVAPGESRVVEMRSADFDPYLIATGPGEARVENDDCTDGDATLSCVVLDAPGVWEIVATSFEPGEAGAYTLVTDVR